MPDLLCVADACCWVGQKKLVPQTDPSNPKICDCISTLYWSEQRRLPFANSKQEVRIPVATALKNLLHRLSKEHGGLRSLAIYFDNSMKDTGVGSNRYWPIKIVFSAHNIKEYETIWQAPSYKIPDDFKY